MNALKGKKILVTGGAGFMGSHLSDYLVKQGHDVVVLDNLSGGRRDYVNPRAQFIHCDLRSREACVKAVENVEIIYHLAAHAAEGQSVFAPTYTTETNLIGFLNLLTAAISKDIETFVFTSSMSVYGTQPELPMREDHPRQPQDPYGITKAACEQLLEIYEELFDFNYVILRPHNVYGERQIMDFPYRNVIAIFMNRIMQGKPPIIYGDGEQERAFTYISDCTPYVAESAFIDQAYGEIINIGSEEVVTINKLAEIVLEKMGSDLRPIKFPPRPSEVKFAYCSSAKARRLLGYETTTPLEVGIERMAKWAKEQGPQPFRYWNWKDFEIKKKVPTVWKDKRL